MNEVKLDTTKLLGFKIVASKDASIALLSPKIGGKLCVVGDMPLTAAVDAEPAKTRSEI
jgi:hypothetical protein